jgi:hypothetical protein
MGMILYYLVWILIYFLFLYIGLWVYSLIGWLAYRTAKILIPTISFNNKTDNENKEHHGTNNKDVNEWDDKISRTRRGDRVSEPTVISPDTQTKDKRQQPNYTNWNYDIFPNLIIPAPFITLLIYRHLKGIIKRQSTKCK